MFRCTNRSRTAEIATAAEHVEQGDVGGPDLHLFILDSELPAHGRQQLLGLFPLAAIDQVLGLHQQDFEIGILRGGALRPRLREAAQQRVGDIELTETTQHFNDALFFGGRHVGERVLFAIARRKQRLGIGQRLEQALAAMASHISVEDALDPGRRRVARQDG